MAKMRQKSNGAPNLVEKRAYLVQSEMPGLSLEEALRIPTAIVENFAGTTATPLQVAEVLDLSPQSGGFRQLCGAAVARTDSRRI